MTALPPSVRTDPFLAARRRMVEEQLRARGIAVTSVLAAMRTVPRHEFVPAELRDQAYEDRALALGVEQSLSQPYIVARMTELANVRPGGSVLEIGTGSGYQAAVLAELNVSVRSIELDPSLAAQAQHNLQRLHYRSVEVRAGDGRVGWPEAAPFDAILVTAAVEEVPAALLRQLAAFGTLVAPVGRSADGQTLRVVSKNATGRMAMRDVMPVRFVRLA